MNNLHRIKFIEADHTYWRDGNRVPNVTNIIGNVGLIDDEYYTPESRERGDYIHTASIYVDDDDLDWDCVPDDYIGFLYAYEKFLREVQPIWEATEEIVFNEKYNVVGTLDRRGLIFNRKGIVDLKSGAEEKWHRLQLAGYEDCFEEPYDKFTLYLRRNGTYKLKQHKDRFDLKAFRLAVGLSNWKGL